MLPKVKYFLLFFILASVYLFFAWSFLFFPFKLKNGYTKKIPKINPVRLDSRQIWKYKTRNIPYILNSLKDKTIKKKDLTSDDLLLDNLPNEPFPFSKDRKIENEKWLQDYAHKKSLKLNSDITEKDLQLVGLSILASTKLNVNDLPKKLNFELNYKNESDTFEVKLKNNEMFLKESFLVGNFDKDKNLEIIDKGGLRKQEIFINKSNNISLKKDGKGLGFYSHKLYSVDFDNDGDLDVFAIRGNNLPNSLFKNDGNGNFKDVTIEVGLLSFNDTTCAKWFDFDNDGLMDVLVGSNNHPLYLYKQNKNGKFSSIAWNLKLWVPKGVRSIEVGDISGDGYLDFFIGIDNLPDRLYVNYPSSDNKKWRFKDIAATSGFIHIRNGSAKMFDWNNDDKLDILLIDGIKKEGGALHLYQNFGDLNFSDITQLSKLENNKNVVSIGIVDLDNNGFFDLYLGTSKFNTNKVMWNIEGIEFKDVSVSSKGSYLDHPIEIETIDIDMNGFSDIFYLTDLGDIRCLDSDESIGKWININIKKLKSPLNIKIEIRDQDWVLKTIFSRINNLGISTLGVGDAKIIETIDIRNFKGEVIKSWKNIKPNTKLTLDI